MRPERTYPRCETWHESVPAIGLTLFDHFQPGSNVALPTTCPPMLRTSALPIPSNGRVSSGESKFLTSACATSAPLSWIGYRVRPYLNVARRQVAVRPRVEPRQGGRRCPSHAARRLRGLPDRSDRPYDERPCHRGP